MSATHLPDATVTAAPPTAIRRHTRRLVAASAVSTAVGLASGLFYREFTKHFEFDGRSQLNVAHTHWLVLGTMFGLIFALVEDRFLISQRTKVFTAFWWTWLVGLVLTGGMQIVKGSMQVAGTAGSDSPALAGVSGLGHMSLTAAFILFFLALWSALGKDDRALAAR